MTSSAAARWLLLATLWSLQYIFMRVSVPVFGTGLVAEARGFFGALFLVPWVLLVTRETLGLGRHWRDHLAVTRARHSPARRHGHGLRRRPLQVLAVELAPFLAEARHRVDVVDPGKVARRRRGMPVSKRTGRGFHGLQFRPR